MDARQEQPAPTPNGRVAIWNLVIDDYVEQHANIGSEIDMLVLADMRDRSATGRKRYGVALQAHNGRVAIVDAYHEALDLCAYTRQAIEEGRTDLDVVYGAALGIVRTLRAIIAAD